MEEPSDDMDDLTMQIQHFATKEARIGQVIAGTSEEQLLRRCAREEEQRKRKEQRQGRDEERVAERERRKAEREAKRATR
jgi:hypothetical protein